MASFENMLYEKLTNTGFIHDMNRCLIQIPDETREGDLLIFVDFFVSPFVDYRSNPDKINRYMDSITKRKPFDQPTKHQPFIFNGGLAIPGRIDFYNTYDFSGITLIGQHEDDTEPYLNLEDVHEFLRIHVYRSETEYRKYMQR